jgi:hypothetical protein
MQQFLAAKRASLERAGGRINRAAAIAGKVLQEGGF